MTHPDDFHILVVDDHDAARSAVCEFLNQLGYTKLTTAHNGAEAVSHLKSDPSINFIISDWEMPLINGQKLLSIVRAHPTWKNLPFLIITSPGSLEREKVLLAAESHVDAYIIKPFRIHALKEKINSVLKLSEHGRPRKVILADDDPDSSTMVQEYLRNVGFKDLEVFQDGKSALDFLERHHQAVGLVIADWEMPTMTGVELLAQCKSNPHLQEIPFLIITSQGSMERMKLMQAAKYNVDDYLLKPFTGNTLKDRIDKALARSHQQQLIRKHLEDATEKLERGFPDAAAKAFQKVLKLDPNYDLGLMGMADVTLKTKAPEAAIELYRQAALINPYRVEAYLKLSFAYERADQIGEAISILKSALKFVSFSEELHCRLAELYVKRKMFHQAREEIEHTLQIDPGHARAQMLLSQIEGHTPKG